MPRRSQKWILHENKDGSWDLSRGGRYLYQGLRSRAEAIKRMKNYYRDGEPVILEESDGYRANVTAQLKRSGVI